EAVAAFPKVEAALDVAPARRDAFYNLLVRSLVRKGSLAEAARVAELRARLRPVNMDAMMEYTRLISATGQDPNTFLNDLLPTLEGPADKARLIAEQVKQHLARKRVDAARDALKAGASLPPRTTAGWLKLAEGYIAQAAGQNALAQLAYSTVTH